MIAELEDLHLTEEQQLELRSFVKQCVDCGMNIIAHGRQERCLLCAAKRQREKNKDWAKKNYKAVAYQHDKYISNPTRRRKNG